MSVSAGLRLSNSAEGDEGLYFTVYGPVSYGMGKEGIQAYRRNMIEDCFGTEALEHFLNTKTRLSTVVVVEVDPVLLMHAQNGSRRSVMIPRPYFEHFTDAGDDDGYFYLPPHAILAAVDLSAISGERWHAPAEHDEQLGLASGGGRAGGGGGDGEGDLGGGGMYEDPLAAEREADRQTLETVGSVFEQLDQNDRHVTRYTEEAAQEPVDDGSDTGGGGRTSLAGLGLGMGSTLETRLSALFSIVSTPTGATGSAGQGREDPSRPRPPTRYSGSPGLSGLWRRRKKVGARGDGRGAGAEAGDVEGSGVEEAKEEDQDRRRRSRNQNRHGGGDDDGGAGAPSSVVQPALLSRV